MQQDQAHLLEQPIGEIAVSRPGATAVFRRHKLDFCCGGSISLDEAARKRGIEPSVIAAELEGLSCDEEPLPDSVEDIIGHILTRYHEVHRRELAELLRLARKVESVHADRADAPKGLYELLAHMQAELESHMQKEEQVLFPMMLAGGSPMIVHPIDMMRHEHDEHGAELAKLSTLTRDMTAPDDACRSWRALYAGLAKFADDLVAHVHVENNMLFPRFER